MKSDIHRELGGVIVDVGRAGNVRVKRMIYPPGFDFTKDLGPIIGNDYCMHSHAGFMAQGQINVRFKDGCVEEYKAPCFVAVEPDHEGWVVGDEPAVLIEMDFETDTTDKLGIQRTHNHNR